VLERSRIEEIKEYENRRDDRYLEAQNLGSKESLANN